MNLTGRWEGIYTYGKGYSARLIGKSEPFQFEITDKNGDISGTCVDNVVNAKDGNEAHIQGVFNGSKLFFKKKYKYHLGFDKSGSLVIIDNLKHNGIDYTGKLRRGIFSRKVSFRGEWSLVHKFMRENNPPRIFIVKGTWRMTKVNNG